MGGITGPINFNIGSKTTTGSNKNEGVRRTLIKAINKTLDIASGESANQGLNLFFNDINTLNQRRERDVVEPDKTRVNLP